MECEETDHENDKSVTCLNERDGPVSKSDKNKPLKDLSKDELILKVKQLEAHVTQLKNIIAKTDTKKSPFEKNRIKRPFDFTRYNTRHVALKIAYLGWDYNGFTVQEDTDKTIEAALFEALIKAKLIEKRETSNYHRCGRTDKGVSAFSQVISIDVRTNLSQGQGVIEREVTQNDQQTDEEKTEVKYSHVLNRLLPPEVRVLAWAPVNEGFSARFDCQERTYKYFFPKGHLNTKLMEKAGQRLLGEHDFRNFCKMDVGHGVTSFMRNIFSLSIKECVDSVTSTSYQMYELTVTGKAFLWHQIRSIIAVLFLVGRGTESSEIIDELLDVENFPRRPQYTMAADLPLVFFNTEFDGVNWIYDEETLQYNIQDLQKSWCQAAIKSAMMRAMLSDLEMRWEEGYAGQDNSGRIDEQVKGDHFLDWLSPSWHGKTYKRLLERPKCVTLEEKIELVAKRQKTSAVKSTEDTS